MTDDNYYETRATDAVRDDANQGAQVWALLGIREQLERIADHLQGKQRPTMIIVDGPALSEDDVKRIKEQLA